MRNTSTPNGIATVQDFTATTLWLFQVLRIQHFTRVDLRTLSSELIEAETMREPTTGKSLYFRHQTNVLS